MVRLTKGSNTNTSDPDPYSYPPSSTSLPVEGYTNASTDYLTSQQFTGRDEAVPGGRNRPTYPPAGEDYAYEKGLNPVTRGSIAAQVSSPRQAVQRCAFGLCKLTSHRDDDRWRQRVKFQRRKG